MLPLVKRALLILVGLISCAVPSLAQMPTSCIAGTNIYYIDKVGGADTNTQTQAKSKSTPWAHAPYMASATNNSLAYTHTVGDCFIFKGGVTWNNSDFTFNITKGGNSSTQDYYGTDPTWFTGGSFSRPIIDAQSISTPANLFNFSAGYITADNFEIINMTCDNTHTQNSFSTNGNHKIFITNNYEHSYKAPSGGCLSLHVIQFTASGGSPFCDGKFDHNIINGADGNAQGGYYTEAIHGNDCSPVTSNVIHDVCSAVNTYSHIVAYNTIYNVGQTAGVTPCSTTSSSHPDCIQDDTDSDIHDNLVYNCTGEWLQVSPQGLAAWPVSHVYNNVLFTQASYPYTPPPAIQVGTGGDSFAPNGVIYIYNNTMQCGSSSCIFFEQTNVLSATIQNNHQINSTGGATVCINNPPFNNSACTKATSSFTYTASSELYETPAQATTAGYTEFQTNPYSPTSGSSPTVGTATNLTSQCTSTIVLCTDTQKGSGVGAGNIAIAGRTQNNRPSGGSWDAGAYEFVSGAITHICSAGGENRGGGHVTSVSTSTCTVTAGQYAMCWAVAPWGAAFTACTDTGGNTCTLLTPVLTGGNGGTGNYAGQWSGCVITVSQASDVFTCNFSSSPFVACVVSVFSNPGNAWVRDVGQLNSSSIQTGTSLTLGSATITTAANNEAIACGWTYVYPGSTYTWTAGSIGSSAAALGAVSGSGTSGLASDEYYLASAVVSGAGATITTGTAVTGGGAGCMSVSSGPLNPPFLTVNAASVRQAISPNVYGTNGWGNTSSQYTTFAAATKMPFVRQGGDGATRYNWSLGTNCDGVDFWFVCQGTPTIDTMITAYRAAYSGVQILATIPTFPQVSNVTAGQQICSYPAGSYPTQTAYNTIAGVSCGNGCTAGAGCTLQDTNLSLNMTPNTTTIEGTYIDHLIATYGNCAGGGVCFYQLDNEPNGWNNIPRDGLGTSPAPNYSTIESYGETYANLIHTKDTTAKISGPSDYLYSGWTQNCDQCGTTNCPGLSGNVCPQYAFQWWLYKMHADSIPITSFDEHIYLPTTSNAVQLQSPRELWDATYSDGNGPFGGAIQMIPRFKTAVATYYPGLTTDVSEWGAEAGNNYIVDALTDADILGVFGYQGVSYADHFFTIVGTLHDNQHFPQSQYAWDMFLNYDGAGGGFGDTSVSSTSTEPTQATLTVYGAKRASDGKLTVLVTNKTLSAVNTTLTISGFSPVSGVDVYTMASSNLGVATTMPAITHTTTSESVISSGYSYPPYSSTLFVFAPTSGVCAISTAPSTLSFGNQQILIGSPTQAITVSNTSSDTNCTSVSVAMQTGTQFSQTNTCSATLTFGSNCTVTVTFTPTTIGAKSDNVVVSSNISPVSAPVTGTGINLLTGNVVSPPLGVSVIAH